ncbi:MAG: sigma-70 family RNA polymerase sigma factor [Planctomycetota bacterium]
MQHARSRDDFEEIQQELWLRVLESPNRSQAEIRWLSAIARNIAREIARGRYARTVREHRYARERVAVTLPRFPERIDRETLVEALLRGLSRADQALLWSHFVEGLRVHELAASLDLTPAATKARLHRGVVRLRELRAGTANGDAPVRSLPSTAG